MTKSTPAAVVQALGLAVFQRDSQGRLRLAGSAPDWLAALWLQTIEPEGVLRADASPFLENFLVDATACWTAAEGRRVTSGPWVERDGRGVEHSLQATALVVSGRAWLVIEAPSPAFEERTKLVQKAHELALAHEKLQRAERALAEEKCSLEQRVQERTAELSRTNAALTQEIATRRRFAERLQAMHELDKAILAAQSPGAIAEAALRRLRDLLPCDEATVVELDPDQHRATILASRRHDTTAGGDGWPLDAAQLHQCRVLQSGHLQRIRNQPNLFAPAFREPERAAGVSPAAPHWPLIIDVPLIAEETLVGVLNLVTAAPDTFGTEQEEIALEVAAQLAVALLQARLFHAVAAGREQLRALSLRLVEVQEAERRFVAHELHDEIGQVLTGLKLTLQRAGRAVTGSLDPTHAEAIAIVDDLMQRVRQLSLDLRPQMLDDLGLLPALDWLFKRCFNQTGLRVQFKHTALSDRLAPALETAVFRIVQEALTNVARHAGVKEATVRLWHDEPNRTLGVQVQDTGAGFDVPRAFAARTSIGLAGMRERATLLGGQFTLDSAPGHGTRLTVELPLDTDTPDSASKKDPVQ